MKRVLRVSPVIFALAVLLLTAPAFAQSVSGAFHVDDRDVEFNAKRHPNGSASGDVKFSGPISVPDQDVDGDGTGDPGVASAKLTMKIDVDCLKVDGNRAVMAGQVRQSSVNAYVGRRLLLTIEDGGEGKNAAPDGYTWGQYRSTSATWVASDAELTVDPGVGLTWDATDFERDDNGDDDDDVSVPSNQPTTVDCQSFPLGSYTLDTLPQGSGNIQVKP